MNKPTVVLCHEKRFSSLVSSAMRKMNKLNAQSTLFMSDHSIGTIINTNGVVYMLLTTKIVNRKC